jgi:hypothetical protein
MFVSQCKRRALQSEPGLMACELSYLRGLVLYVIPALDSLSLHLLLAYSSVLY